MNVKDIARFRADLLAKLHALRQEDDLGRDSQQTVALDQQSVGRLSRMDALQQQAMAKATAARRTSLRQRITAALAQIDTAEFGYCTECGEDIALKRLELDATAPTCISCAKGH